MLTNHKMHIGFDVSQTGSGKAGCGFFAHAMIQAMLEIAPEHRYSLYPSFGDFYFDALMPIHNPYKAGHYGPRHLTREIASAFWTKQAIEDSLKTPDIVHANNFWCPTQLQSSRLIYTFYDMGFVVNPGWSTEANRLGCFNGVFRSSLAADWIVAISEASKAHYLSVFPHFPEERIRVIYPCSRFANTQLAGKCPKALKSISPGQFWLNVGTIEPRKNQRCLAEAYARYLALNGKPMPLVFAGGEGWLMNDFKTYLRELGIDAQVIFTGYISDEELIWLYQNCYANLYCSLFEGFGLPILEGMQFGAPTLNSHSTSMPEIAGEATLLLSPENAEDWAHAMLTLATHPLERERMSLAAREQAGKFIWKQSAEALLELYREALAAPKREELIKKTSLLKPVEMQNKPVNAPYFVGNDGADVSEKQDWLAPQTENLDASDFYALKDTALKAIAVDLTPILPGGENGGAKIFVLELIKQLGELAPETQFILLTQAASHDELKRLETNNIKCMMVLDKPVKSSIWYRLLSASARRIPYLPRKLSYLGYRLNVLLKRKGSHSLLHNIGADLLFCPFTAPTYFELGVPIVCTLYDLQYKTYPEFFAAEDVAHRQHTFVEACRRASMLTAISEYSRQSAIRHGGLRPEKIRTIYLRMAQRIAPEAAQDKRILTKLKLSEKHYLLYPANFWKHKNHEMLLTAFGMACKKGLAPHIKLVCTGAKNTRLSLLADAAEKMNLSEQIVFPGYLTNAELAVLMANSSAVIFPSLYEGFGLPVIEAMAAEIPVACSNLTSLPEVASEAAILFNPRIPSQIAAAIVSLQNDKELREQLIAAGKEQAKIFSDSRRMAQEYWYLFQHALKENHQEDELIGAYEDGKD